MTPHEQSLADMERLLPGEVWHRSTQLHRAVRDAGTPQDALLARLNLLADLNEPDTIRVLWCWGFRLHRGDLADDAAPVLGGDAYVIDAEPIGGDDAPSA